MSTATLTPIHESISLDMTRSSINVWVVDDHSGQRSEVCNLISQAPNIRCTGAFSHCEALFGFIDPLEDPVLPDVVVMDYSLATDDEPKRMNGVAGAARLKASYPGVAIVMLTVNDSTETVFEAIRAGACGYLRRPPTIDNLIAAIRQAHWGGMWMPPMVAQRVGEYFEERAAEGDDEFSLTERELEILQLMEQGLKQKQIAERLFLSVHTVDSHVRNIYAKMHVGTAAAALAKAIRKGLV